MLLKFNYYLPYIQLLQPDTNHTQPQHFVVEKNV